MKQIAYLTMIFLPASFVAVSGPHPDGRPRADGVRLPHRPYSA